MQIERQVESSEKCERCFDINELFEVEIAEYLRLSPMDADAEEV